MQQFKLTGRWNALKRLHELGGDVRKFKEYSEADIKAEIRRLIKSRNPFEKRRK